MGSVREVKESIVELSRLPDERLHAEHPLSWWAKEARYWIRRNRTLLIGAAVAGALAAAYAGLSRGKSEPSRRA